MKMHLIEIEGTKNLRILPQSADIENEKDKLALEVNNKISLKKRVRSGRNEEEESRIGTHNIKAK